LAPASLGRRTQKGFHSITVNGNWRVIFRFVGQDVELDDYLDYH
jgi:proteic killer suppression protein